jgi:Tat protein translocase TatB subunit
MEVFGIGLPEILLVAVIALIVLGPERLPEAARTLGKGLADLRRAVEPARSAWIDLTSEVTSATNSVRSVAAASGANLKSPPGEKTTAVPIGNPWSVHPIMADMTEEERATFLEGGKIPDRLLEQLDRNDSGGTNGRVKGAFPEVVDIDYPMPHNEVSFSPAPPFQHEAEEINYPEPGTATKSMEDTG